MNNPHNNFDFSIFNHITKIKDDLLNTKISNVPGLMGGSTGELLFLLYYYELTKEQQILDYILCELENSITNIDYNEIGYSFSYGIAGLGWFIDLMKRKRLIENSSDDIFESVDNIIFNDSLQNLTLGHYDYISGSLGALLYFLKKENPPIFYINQYIGVLNQLKECKAGQFFIYENNKRISCNLGLSHGIPSIIAILFIAYDKKICPDLSLELINGFVKFLISNMQKPKKMNETYFSYSTDSEKIPTRLAWCYGDLSIGYVLYRSSLVLNNKGLMDTSMEILFHTAKRLDLYSNMIFDAGLCHGSAGIAHIFRKLSKMPGCDSFMDVSSYWYQRTIEFGMISKGIGGYLFQRNNLKLPLRGLLEGASGVGVSLISGFFDVDTSWDESLLLI